MIRPIKEPDTPAWEEIPTRLTLIPQPFEDGLSVQALLEKIAADASFVRLDIIVAWAKRSGFRQVRPALEEFRARGGYVRIILGISQGGATRQGLQSAVALTDEAFVFHDAGGRTFHPKLYVATADDRAIVMVGSQNLTRGGTVENFELGVLLEADLTEPTDVAFVSDVDAYIKRLLADHEVCHPLTLDLIGRLAANAAYRVGDEDRWASRRDGEDESDNDSVTDDNEITAEGIFGRSRFQLRRGRSQESHAPSRQAGTSHVGSREVGQPPATSSSTGSLRPRILRRWFKPLSRSDAQRLGGASNPTGHLTLVKAGHPIDASQYFRDEFFGDALWRTVDSQREQATVVIRVEIDGEDLGDEAFTIDHNPAFEAGQGNRSSTLRWGDRMNRILTREIDVTNRYVTLEQMDDGSYKLVIADAPTGEFLR